MWTWTRAWLDSVPSRPHRKEAPSPGGSRDSAAAGSVGRDQAGGRLPRREPPVCRGGCARPRVRGPRGAPGSQRCRAPHAAVLTVLPAKEDSSAHPFLSAHRCSGKAETCQIRRKKLLAHSNNTEVVPGFVYCRLVCGPMRLL